MFRGIIVFACLTSTAQAQNLKQYPDAKYGAWFAAQYAKSSSTGEEQSGGWCCNLGDGWGYYDLYTPNPDGSVTLLGSNTKITIPAYKVLDGSYEMVGNELRGGPNPTGHAVIWTKNADQPLADASNVFCFSPGSFG